MTDALCILAMREASIVPRYEGSHSVMSWKTPTVQAGLLHTADMTGVIEIESPAWFDWLADEHHRCFHFVHTAGDFTARKERKQRGQWYWVAYRQVHRKLYKSYLGKSNILTQARLDAAAQNLTLAESRTTVEYNVDEPHS